MERIGILRAYDFFVKGSDHFRFWLFQGCGFEPGHIRGNRSLLYAFRQACQGF